ncbi:hypothetical protein D9M68_303960 [compost metagenome]
MRGEFREARFQPDFAIDGIEALRPRHEIVEQQAAAFGPDEGGHSFRRLVPPPVGKQQAGGDRLGALKDRPIRFDALKAALAVETVERAHLAHEPAQHRPFADFGRLQGPHFLSGTTAIGIAQQLVGQQFGNEGGSGIAAGAAHLMHEL